MDLIRTFHPIGQGAFYSERHFFSGREFTVVYDCGSATLKGKKLENKIKSTFPKDHPIDILFISHFHFDHINGIEILKKHCEIRSVVIPEMDPDAKTLIKVTNLIDNDFSDTRLIDDPADFFGDIPIISIEETTEGDNSIESDAPTEISEIDTTQTKESGTVFIPTANVDWFFIPFNYKHDERKKQFEAALNKFPLKLADIDTIDKIHTNKANIVKAYEKVDGDLNKNSMILYSGKRRNDQIKFFEHYHHFCYPRSFNIIFQSGCLYLGDIDLKQVSIVKDIQTKLNAQLPFIGTIQVPHHGSVHNFDSSILEKGIHCVCAIFSYGTTNTYGHPSDRIISVIITNNIYPHLVTEQQHSMVTQWK